MKAFHSICPGVRLRQHSIPRNANNSFYNKMLTLFTAIGRGGCVHFGGPGLWWIRLTIYVSVRVSFDTIQWPVGDGGCFLCSYRPGGKSLTFFTFFSAQTAPPQDRFESIFFCSRLATFRDNLFIFV